MNVLESVDVDPSDSGDKQEYACVLIARAKTDEESSETQWCHISAADAAYG